MRKYRSLLLFGLDLFIIVMMYVLATLIRFDFGSEAFDQIVNVAFLIPRIIVVYGFIFVFLSIHKSLWSTSSLYEALLVSFAIVTSAISLWLLNQIWYSQSFIDLGNNALQYLRINTIVTNYDIPNGVHLIAMLLNIIMLNFARFSYRSYRFALNRVHSSKVLNRALIYGAGEAGQMMLKEIQRNTTYQYKVVGFMDDDTFKHESLISGIPVMGGYGDLLNVVSKNQIDLIIVAIPSAPLSIQRKVIQKAFSSGAEVFTLHGSKAMLTKGNIMKSFGKVSINDVLGRNEVKLNNELIASVVNDKVVLVTGAAGSIGSELVRQIAVLKPKLIIGADINENELYSLEQALKILERQNKEKHHLFLL